MFSHVAAAVAATATTAAVAAVGFAVRYLNATPSAGLPTHLPSPCSYHAPCHVVQINCEATLYQRS